MEIYWLVFGFFLRLNKNELHSNIRAWIIWQVQRQWCVCVGVSVGVSVGVGVGERMSSVCAYMCMYIYVCVNGFCFSGGSNSWVKFKYRKLWNLLWNSFRVLCFISCSLVGVSIDVGVCVLWCMCECKYLLESSVRVFV